MYEYLYLSLRSATQSRNLPVYLEDVISRTAGTLACDWNAMQERITAETCGVSRPRRSQLKRCITDGGRRVATPPRRPRPLTADNTRNNTQQRTTTHSNTTTRTNMFKCFAATIVASCSVISTCVATVHDFDWTVDAAATGQATSPYCTTPCTADPRYAEPLAIATGDSVRLKCVAPTASPH